MVAAASIKASPPVYEARTFCSPDSVGSLVARARKALAEEFGRALAPLGLNAAQALVIVILADGRAATAADLCRLLAYDAGAMTRVLDRLEALALVRRLPQARDRRSARLQLTRPGRAAHARVTRVQVEVLNRLLRGFSRAEARALESLLRRMLENAAQ